MKIVIIDHEDSFVYNLAHGFASLGAEVDTLRYTSTLHDVESRQPDAIVLSPGPGHPSDRRITGLARATVEGPLGSLPILGVCLGHQLIAHMVGARIVPGERPVHGETTSVVHDGQDLFQGVPSPFAAARYHSLVVDPDTLPPSLVRTASSEGEVIMAVRASERPTFGVQFHPESYLTDHGETILRNFLALTRR